MTESDEDDSERSAKLQHQQSEHHLLSSTSEVVEAGGFFIDPLTSKSSLPVIDEMSGGFLQDTYPTSGNSIAGGGGAGSSGGTGGNGSSGYSGADVSCSARGDRSSLAGLQQNSINLSSSDSSDDDKRLGDGVESQSIKFQSGINLQHFSRRLSSDSESDSQSG